MVRFKVRYVLAQVQWLSSRPSGRIAASAVQSAVRGCIQREFGAFGLGSMSRSTSIPYWNQETGLLMIRVPRRYHRTLCAALLMLNQLGSGPQSVGVRLDVLHVGGALRTVHEAAIKVDRRANLIDMQASVGAAGVAAVVTGETIVVPADEDFDEDDVPADDGDAMEV